MDGGPTTPGDEVAPVDLRIDHVYLVSCKYLSRNIANPSPARLFDGLLVTSATWAQTDWYQVVAPDEYRRLYEACRTSTGLEDLPDDPVDLTVEDRQRLRDALRPRSYPADAQEAYRALCDAVSVASAERWRANASGEGAQERLLWRLLRIGNASYFLLGADAKRSLRLRIASPWDWRQTYRFERLDIEAASAGQPQVDWAATYLERATSAAQERARPRGGALEPRPLRPTARGQGLPGHAHRRDTGVLRPRRGGHSARALELTPSGVDLSPSFEGPTEGQLVGVLEVSPDREPARDAGDGQAQRLEQSGDVHGGGLTFEIGVGAQDDLGDALAVRAAPVTRARGAARARCLRWD